MPEGDGKGNLEINYNRSVFNCWSCGERNHMSGPVTKLIKKYGNPKILRDYLLIKPEADTMVGKDSTNIVVELPEGYKKLSECTSKDFKYDLAMAYLRERGITDDIIKEFEIGYTFKGKHFNRIIIPSYDSEGKLNYFIARSFEKEPYQKYDAPSVNKTEIIGLEYHINWTVPVILCEGVFDAIAIKRNVVPLFGKSITKALMLKLVESQVKTVYLALDKDALKEALTYSEQLINLGKEVYLIELDGKDPSDLGFTSMTELLQKAKPLTFGELMLRRMKMN